MMQQTIRVDVLGARRITVDGSTFCKLWLGQREDTKDVKGVIPMTMSCEPELIDQLDTQALPRQHDVRVRLQMAGGGKTGMHALEVLADGASTQPPTGTAPAPDSKAGEAKGGQQQASKS